MDKSSFTFRLSIILLSVFFCFSLFAADVSQKKELYKTTQMKKDIPVMLKIDRANVNQEIAKYSAKLKESKLEPYLQNLMLEKLKQKGTEKIWVTLIAQEGTEINRSQLEANGAEISSIYKNRAVGYVSAEDLQKIDKNLTDIVQIRRPYEPESDLGDFSSEGVEVMKASAFHDLDIAGDGVRVGVIDLGFGYLSDLQATGEMPAGIIGVDFTGTGLETGTAHGTAVAHIIYEMAPKCEIYCLKINSSTSLGNAIDYCIANAVRIVNHSVSWSPGPYDGNGYIDMLANYACDNGIMWFNSAGNYKRGHWSGNYHDLFGFNEWITGSNINQIFPQTEGTNIRVDLSWTGANEDYGVGIVVWWSGAWHFVNMTDQDNSTWGNYEWANYTVPAVFHNSYFGVVVWNNSATNDAFLNMFVSHYWANIQYEVYDYTMKSPAVADRTLAIAAINWWEYDDGPSAWYSSQGPRVDGEKGLIYSGPTATTCPIYGSFTGTSSSSPHVAGAAALISELVDWGQRRVTLHSMVQDIGPWGWDTEFGYGKIVMVPLEVAFDADNNVGYGPLTVQFNSDCRGYPETFLWDFGDGTTSSEENPIHTYEDVGVYTVTLNCTNNLFNISKTEENLVMVYDEVEHFALTDLELVEGSSPCWEGAGWDNAIDHDTHQKSGTTYAKKKKWAIFKFADDATRVIDEVRLMSDTRWDDPESDWVDEFSVEVSTDGNTFQPILNDSKTNGDWESYTFDSVSAKYIKLILEPNFGWKQLGEFEVYEAVEPFDMSESSVIATSPVVANGLDECTVTIKLADSDGNPISGIPGTAFKVIVSGTQNMVDPVVESSVAGTYSSTIKSLEAGDKSIIVRVYGMKVLTTPVIAEFTGMVSEKAALALVEGTTCWPGEGWDNAIDGDVEGGDGTVSAGPKWRDCYGIFEFADKSTKYVCQLRLMTDTGLDYKEHLVTDYQVETSHDGVNYTVVYVGHRDFGGWETITIFPVQAKYIKLVLLQPKHTWRQIGEFEICTLVMPGRAFAGNQLMSSSLSLPTIFDVAQNYPNPFNPETAISFQLPENADVTICIYNVLGQEIRTLLDNSMNAGRHKVVWNGLNNFGQKAASGIYFCHFKAQAENGKIFTRKLKMMLIM